jgi:hypothetical protein
VFELKRISREGIPSALEKAERYRLLNQARQAESICLDVLAIDPRNQEALVALLLARTDQFGRPGHEATASGALEALGGLEGEYERAYYEGVIHERWGKSFVSGSTTIGSGLGWIRKAMSLFEKAQALSPKGNDDAILRWNACARLVDRMDKRGAEEPWSAIEFGGDDAPVG